MTHEKGHDFEVQLFLKKAIKIQPDTKILK